MSDDLEVLFSRSGASHPLGKLIAVEKTVVPEVVSDILVERARALQMTVTELHREILCRWACGGEIDRLLSERRRVASMNGAGSGPESGGDA
ncbi:hypothetical protein SAMN05444172_2606 [Burkholderia sp. GAS332]|nr:hypothetical protein SAMN05444172_2606 [Burkholderia sp. GAS332]